MTKAEIKKQQLIKVIEILETQFNAINIEDSEGGRMSFEIELEGNIHCGEFHRRDFDVIMRGNVRFANESDFSEKEIQHRDEARYLEGGINRAIFQFFNK